MKLTSLKLNLKVEKTRRQLFIWQIVQVVYWATLDELITRRAAQREGLGGLVFLQMVLWVHFMKMWFRLSDLALEYAFFDMRRYREFEESGHLPVESTILRFRRRLGTHKLAGQILSVVNCSSIQRVLFYKIGSVVCATLVAAPSLSKNTSVSRNCIPAGRASRCIFA